MLFQGKRMILGVEGLYGNPLQGQAVQVSHPLAMSRDQEGEEVLLKFF